MDRSAIYMEIEGGPEDDALVAAAVPAEISGTVELHETVMDDEGGMMQMRQVPRIDVPADATVTLEPGGLHVMLLDLSAPLEPGETFDVTLTFEEAGEVVATAEVREP